jgi:endonuclease-8
MPEGPSIVILREELSMFIGKKVSRVSGNAKIDLQRLKGKTIIDMKTWGKHFLICFDDFFIRIHLLMFGRYLINAQKEIPPRFSLGFRGGAEFNFYNCSVKLFEGQVSDLYNWETDTMSEEWNPQRAYRTILLQKEEMICDTLLDQDIFAGVGNIIKNEVLFITKVQPETKNKDLPARKLKEIVKVAREYCFDFLRWKRKFELKKHYQVHMKSICPRCNIKIILKRKTGKRERRSFFCSNCQYLYKKGKKII